MPDLHSKLHLNMLEKFKRKRRLVPRLLKAIKKELTSTEIYGLHWGDPDVIEPLRFIRDRYIFPYVKDDQCALEIGPGGGRWTRYLLDFRKLYVVDYHTELLDELRKNFNQPNMKFIKNNGADFPGIEMGSVDYLFSFGTFVHLDIPLIKAYLRNIKPILKPGANVVIQYADKTKIIGRQKSGFSDNTPTKMCGMVSDVGYKIIEEDLTTLWHSSVVHFTL